jgi:hypothetical protein
MRHVELIGSPPPGDELRWLEDALREFANASLDGDTGDIADAYTITNPPSPDVRTLDAGGATLAQLRAFVATFILDLKNRGTNRGQ